MAADHLRPATSETPTDPVFGVEIQIHKGASAGETHVLRRLPAVIGRSRETDLSLADDPSNPTISRRHVRVDLERGAIAVTDLSTNGTWIGTRRLAQGETATVADGEAVWLGPRTMLTLRSLRPGPPPPVSIDEAPTGEAEGPEAVPAGIPAPAEASAAVRGTGIPLEIRALGRFTVTVAGSAVADSAWGTRKAMMVLSWLAESLERGVPADRLEEALWPDALEGARQALHTAVSRIRRAFRQLPGGTSLPVPLLLERNAYRLHPDYALDYDVATFQARCAQASRLLQAGRGREAAGEMEQALRVYGGPFIEGPSDDWLESRRRALENRRHETAETLASLWVDEGRLPDAIALYQETLEVDPCRESSQVGLIRALLAAGRREEAIRQYHASVKALQKMLNLPPSEGLVALYESAMRGT